MKICLIANAASIHTRRWTNYFAAKGHDVHIISFDHGEGYLESVRIHFVPNFLSLKLWVVIRSINVLIRILQVRRFINKIKPDVVDAHYITHTGYIAAASGFHPFILTAWGSDVLITPKESLYHRCLDKYALKRADLVTCSAENLRQGLIELGVDSAKIRLIRHGVDTQKFSAEHGKEFRNQLGLQGIPVVISIRSLWPIYNVEMLIRAIPLVLQHMARTVFLIVGDGEQRQYLQRLAMDLQVSDNVRFVGTVPHDQIPAYLSSADVYVSTSLSDSESISLEEAMACELVPVVTDIPANRLWISNEVNGFLVPVGDASALAGRILYLLKDKDTRNKFGKVNRGIIKEKSEYNSEMNKMENLYQQLVDGACSEL